MSDLGDFVDQQIEVEATEAQCGQETVLTPSKRDLSDCSSDSDVERTPDEDMKRQMENMKRKLEETEQQLRDLKPQQKRRRIQKVKAPPPPPKPLEEYIPPTVKRTLATLISQLMTVVVVRVDCYAEVYGQWQEMRDSKQPAAALNTLTEILELWSSILGQEDGNSCFLAYMTRCHEAATLFKESMNVQTFKTLHKFFLDLGTPGNSEQRHLKASYSSPTIGTVRDRTFTLSIHAPGSIQHADAGISGQLGFRGAGSVAASTYLRSQEQMLETSQSTTVHRDESLYTLKSTINCGTHTIVLQIYELARLKDLKQKDWWRVAEFRGTVYTDKRKLIMNVVDMEEELANQTDVTCSCTQFAPTQSRK